MLGRVALFGGVLLWLAEAGGRRTKPAQGVLRAVGANKALDDCIEQGIYGTWEKTVVEEFYEPSPRKTELFPTKGHPSVLSKQKFIVVVLDDVDVLNKVAEATSADTLPKKKSLKLWHLGKGKVDEVSHNGVKDGFFRLAAFDLGGLTNYRQRLGEGPSGFVGKRYKVEPIQRDQQMSDAAYRLFDEWKVLAKKEFDPLLRDHLVKWVTSVAKTKNYENSTFQLNELKPEHRVVVTSHDVKEKTGNYYIRRYKDDCFAKKTDADDAMYCAIGPSPDGVVRVTTNINTNNVKYEYATYGSDEKSGTRCRSCGWLATVVLSALVVGLEVTP